MYSNFLKKGFINNRVENKKALIYLKKFINLEILKILNTKTKNFSLDNLHNYFEKNSINKIRLILINKINKNKKFRENYFLLAKKSIFEIIGNELAMQNKINLSIQLPNDETSLLPLHSDTWSGDSPFETVLWVPLVDCYRTKSMFILQSKKYEKFKKLFKNKNIKYSYQLHKKSKKNLKFIKIDYGNFLLFNQNLPHGNVINKTRETRVSLNCRFKGLFTPYSEKKLGNFFSPLIIRPASKVGMNYKYPDE